VSYPAAIFGSLLFCVCVNEIGCLSYVCVSRVFAGGCGLTPL